MFACNDGKEKLYIITEKISETAYSQFAINIVDIITNVKS